MRKDKLFLQKKNLKNLKITVRVLIGGMPKSLKEEVENQNSINNTVLTIKNGGNHE